MTAKTPFWPLARFQICWMLGSAKVWALAIALTLVVVVLPLIAVLAFPYVPACHVVLAGTPGRGHFACPPPRHRP